MRELEVSKVVSPLDRSLALRVVDEVYRQEKQWVAQAAPEIPLDVADRDDQSWFLVAVEGEPAGVIRLLYDPPLEIPAELGVTLEPGVDLERLRRQGRFAEIGRFMILPEHRRSIRVVLSLMRGAIREVVERRYTHFLTDVFEDDPHSPLGFHTRVLGFERIATHRYGDLACDSLRIVLVLDIVRSLRRLEARQDRIWRELGQGLVELMDAVERGAAPLPAAVTPPPEKCYRIAAPQGPETRLERLSPR